MKEFHHVQRLLKLLLWKLSKLKKFVGPGWLRPWVHGNWFINSCLAHTKAHTQMNPRVILVPASSTLTYNVLFKSQLLPGTLSPLLKQGQIFLFWGSNFKITQNLFKVRKFVLFSGFNFKMTLNLKFEFETKLTFLILRTYELKSRSGHS